MGTVRFVDSLTDDESIHRSAAQVPEWIKFLELLSLGDGIKRVGVKQG